MVIFRSVYEKWDTQGEMTLDMADIIEKNLDEYLETEFSQIENLIAKGELETAFGSVIVMTQFVNAAATKEPKIIRRFRKWLKKLHGTLQSIAQKWNADTFSISAGFPSGVTVELSFKV